MNIRTVLKQIGNIAIVLFAVTLLSFALMRAAPVDPAKAYAIRLTVQPSEELMEKLRRDMGLDRSLPAQYALWLKDAWKLDFGKSLVNGKPVLGEFAQTVPFTVYIVVFPPVCRQVALLSPDFWAIGSETDLQECSSKRY